MSSDLGRIGDVLRIFEEETGITPDREKENFVISHWVRKGWSNHDFRLVIKFQYADPRQKEFYSKPGNLNLRMMLNPASESRLEDVLRDLRFQHKKKEVSEEMRLTPKVRLICGEIIPVGDSIQYEQHLNFCFLNKGKCFYPEVITTS